MPSKPRSAPTRTRASPPPTGEDDARLVKHHLAGDHTAFEALYRRHYPAVKARLGRRFAALGDDVDDVVQDSFVSARRHLSGLKEHNLFGPWVFNIARNGALSCLKRRKADAELTEGFDLVAPGHEAEDGYDAAASIEAALAQRIGAHAVTEVPAVAETSSAEDPAMDAVRAALAAAGGDRRKAERRLRADVERERAGRPPKRAVGGDALRHAVEQESKFRLRKAGVTWTPGLNSLLQKRLGDAHSRPAIAAARLCRDAREAMERVAALVGANIDPGEEAMAASCAAWAWLNSYGRLALLCAETATEPPVMLAKLRRLDPQRELGATQPFSVGEWAALAVLVGYWPKVKEPATAGAVLKIIASAFRQSAKRRRRPRR